VAFDYCAFPVLITDRIILRELRNGDAADLLVFRGDSEAQRFNSEPLQTLDQSVALIDEGPLRLRRPDSRAVGVNPQVVWSGRWAVRVPQLESVRRILGVDATLERLSR
jgi:RimJ/RimL family protein N-acetyltransferase